MALRFCFPFQYTNTDTGLSNYGCESFVDDGSATPSYSPEWCMMGGGYGLNFASGRLRFKTSINTADGITVMCWFKPMTQKNWSDVFSLNEYGNGNATNQNRLEMTDSTVHRMYNNSVGSGGYLVPSGTILGTFAHGTWQHIAFVCNGVNTDVYVNGALQGTYKPQNFIVDTICIGGRFDGSCTYNGIISDFRVYDSVVPVSEVIEAARALCVHLPFSMDTVIAANPNLLVNTTDYSPSNPCPETTQVESQSRPWHVGEYAVIPGETYWLQAQNSTAGGLIDIKVDDKNVTLPNSNMSPSNAYHSREDWNVWKFEIPTGTSGYADIYMYSNGKLCNVKFEHGLKYTAFVPNEGSPRFYNVYPTNYNLLVNESVASDIAERSVGFTVKGGYARLCTSETYWSCNSGKTYTCSVWLKSSVSGMTPSIRVQFYASESSSVSVTGNAIPAMSYGLSTVTWTMTEEQRAYTRMEICINFGDNANAGYVFYRGLKLERGGIHTGYSTIVASSVKVANSAIGSPSTDVIRHGTFIPYDDGVVNNGSLRGNEDSYYLIRGLGVWTQRTVAFWSKPLATGHKGLFHVMNFPRTPGQPWIETNFDNAALCVTLRGITSSAGGNAHKAGLAIMDGKWHHYAWVWDNGVSRAYIDGVHSGTDVTWSTADGIKSTLDSVELPSGYVIGHSYETSDDASVMFTDPVSDFRIYNTALTDGDIARLCNASHESGETACDGIIEYKAGAYLYVSDAPASPILDHYKKTSFQPGPGNNKCINYGAFIITDSVNSFTVECDIAWNNFLASDDGPFRIMWQGVRIANDGATSWSGASPLTDALNNAASITTRVTSSTVGSYHYHVNFSVDATWRSTYKGQYWGIRCDYSNGSGTIIVSNMRIYPSSDIRTS